MERFRLICTLPDRFPTKQGLKHSNHLDNRFGITFSQTDFQQNKDWNRNHRTDLFVALLLPDRFPTKQGLKLGAAIKEKLKRDCSQTDFQQNKDWNQPTAVHFVTNLTLPDRFPTKQGLKHKMGKISGSISLAPRPISNKTRIETPIWKIYIVHKIQLPDRFPTKQGLKRCSGSFILFASHSQTDFQQNKDWNFHVIEVLQCF